MRFLTFYVPLCSKKLSVHCGVFDQGLQNWTGGALNTIKLIGIRNELQICKKLHKGTGTKMTHFSVKLFNFSVIFAPVPLCKFLQIWSSFLSTLLCSKYLQSNFKVPGPLWSLSWDLSFTVLHESHFKKKLLTFIIIIYTTKLQFAKISKTMKKCDFLNFFDIK